MHEYHEAIHIIEHAVDAAKELGYQRVNRIHLVIGDDSGYSGESIRLHFEEVSAGTICEGAEICVRQVKTMLRCPNCHELFVRKPFHDECPHCNTPGEPSEIGREMAMEGIDGE